MWQHLWGHSRISFGEFDFGECSRTRVMFIFILEAYRLSTNIEHTLSFYALLWKLIWKRWALRILYFLTHMYRVFTLNYHGLPRVTFERHCRPMFCACLVLLWRLGLVGLALCRKHTASLREIHGVSIYRIMHFYDSTKSLQNCVFSLKFNPFGCNNTSGDIVESFWMN